jgi:hypothetical protein
MTINPALFTGDNPGQEGCIVGGDLTKLLAYVNMLLLLIAVRIMGEIASGQIHNSK